MMAAEEVEGHRLLLFESKNTIPDYFPNVLGRLPLISNDDRAEWHLTGCATWIVRGIQSLSIL